MIGSRKEYGLQALLGGVFGKDQEKKKAEVTTFGRPLLSP